MVEPHTMADCPHGCGKSGACARAGALHECPVHQANGGGAPYVSPYGKFEGLRCRLVALDRRLRAVKVGPFYGGFIRDLEVVLRFLNATEFAEHLRVHGNDEEMRWAADILEALDRGEDYERLLDDIHQAVEVRPNEPEAEAVERAGKLGDDVRAVLEELGALDKGDTTTDVPALLRVLLA